ncbi:Fe2+-enterobactin ABC transporter substrate-binding protein [Actinomycetaceae bacterium L2_0104]
MRSLTKRFFALAAVGLTSLSLTACGNSSESEGSPSTTESTVAASSSGEWPRTIEHEMGEVTLDAKPERIVSTSVSVTGTLLAIDAPVVASAATSPSEITDDKGFFTQWSDVAEERNVDVLYDNLEFDMEALIAADPDLVVISTSGADSVADQYEQISAEFPTIVVDYSRQTWQDLATELGDATGNEEGAENAIADFDEYAEDAASKITAPEGGTSIVSFNGPGSDQGIAKTTGPHAQLMESLGLEVIPADDALDTSEQARDDFVFVTYENLSQAVGGGSVFLLTGTDETVEAFTSDAVLANPPAVQSEQVYPLGPTSFRIDYYSGKQFIDAVVDALS